MERKIIYVCRTCRWFDRLNGNTYHSVRVTRTTDGATIAHPLTYGYGDSYRQTALEIMLKAGWLPPEYHDTRMGKPGNVYTYERENNYPILWEVSDGLKRDAVHNGLL